MDPLSKLIEERDQSEASKRLERIKKVSNSLDIFIGNFQQLMDLINSYDQDIAAWDLRKRSDLHQTMKDITRLLFNFTASVMSLVDHTRQLYDSFYKDNGSFPDYDKYIDDRFKNNEYHQFLQGLRNFMIHAKVPAIGAGMQWNHDLGAKQYLYLQKNELQHGDKWSTLAKEFISKQEDHIDLKPIIQVYFKMVMEFHEWLQKRFYEIHTHDIQTIQAIEERMKPYQAKLIHDKLHEILIHNELKSADPFEEFAGLIHPQLFASINMFELSQQKMLALFKYFEDAYNLTVSGDIYTKYLEWALNFDDGPSQPKQA